MMTRGFIIDKMSDIHLNYIYFLVFQCDLASATSPTIADSLSISDVLAKIRRYGATSVVLFNSFNDFIRECRVSLSAQTRRMCYYYYDYY